MGAPSSFALEQIESQVEGTPPPPPMPERPSDDALKCLRWSWRASRSERASALGGAVAVAAVVCVSVTFTCAPASDGLPAEGHYNQLFRVRLRLLNDHILASH